MANKLFNFFLPTTAEKPFMKSVGREAEMNKLPSNLIIPFLFSFSANP